MSASLLLAPVAGAALLAAPAAAAPGTHASDATAAEPLLRQGSSGQAVRDWQRVLERLVLANVLDLPRVVVDGQFGPQTAPPRSPCSERRGPASTASSGRAPGRARAPC
ncbi:MAG: hypothetical protein LH469_11465 [Frankiaceae bacterium]|nr:hypothetical protein [Frankiaceae bacterium]